MEADDFISTPDAVYADTLRHAIQYALTLALSQRAEYFDAAVENLDSARDSGSIAWLTVTFAAVCGRMDAVRTAWQWPILDSSFYSATSKATDLLEKNEDHDAAVQLGALLVELNPNHPDVRFDYAVSLRRAGNPTQALQEIERVLESEPRAKHVFYTRGNIFRSLERFHEALSSYESALEIDPDDVSTLNNYGLTLYETGQAARACEVLEQAIDFAPDDAVLWSNLGNAYEALGNDSKAIQCLELAHVFDPEYDAPLQSLAALYKRSPSHPNAATFLDAYWDGEEES